VDSERIVISRREDINQQNVNACFQVSRNLARQALDLAATVLVAWGRNLDDCDDSIVVPSNRDALSTV
jgi:hypothetical protein